MASEPVRLYKTSDDGMKKGKWCEYIEGWVLSHPLLCATALILILLALFVTVCFLIVGTSATESGMVYNKFNSVILIGGVKNYLPLQWH